MILHITCSHDGSWNADVTTPIMLYLLYFSRYLASGESFASLSLAFRVGAATVGIIVRETCSAIWLQMCDIHLKMPTTEDEWLAIAAEFMDLWQYPNCVGALDGKHVLIKAPPNSGSLYFNYKVLT